MELATKFTIFGGITSYTFMTLAVMALVIILWKHKLIEQLPNSVKMRLITYSIYAPYTLGLYVCFQIEHSWYVILYEPAYRCILMVSVALFLYNHWKFACQYLQTACLFKQAFASRHSTSALDQLKKRKFHVRIIEHSVTALLASVFIYFIVTAFTSNDETWPLQFQLLWYVGPLTFLMVTMLSMQHIQKSSESLKDIGIDKNYSLTSVYIAIWIVMICTLPAMSTISYIIPNNYY